MWRQACGGSYPAVEWYGLFLGVMTVVGSLTLGGLWILTSRLPAWDDGRPPAPEPRSRIDLLGHFDRRLLVQVLFVSRGRDSVLVDAVVVGTGTPITLEVCMPRDEWIAGCVELLLERCAAEGQVVEVAIRESRGRPQAGLSTGRSTVLLDLKRSLAA